MNIKQIAVAGLLLASVSSVMATNIRPVVTDGSLQGIFDGIGSSITVSDDQMTDAYFNNQTTGTNATYVASMSWDAFNYPFEFGIYEENNIANTVALFKDSTQGTGNSNPGDYTTLYFNEIAGIISTVYTDAQTGIMTTIGSTGDWMDSFGFYFSWDDGANIYYGDDDLNNGAAAMLVFEGNGDDVNINGQTGNDANHHYVAMEGFGGNNNDFNDIVVQLESITPVPAPGTLALMGLGLLGLGAGRRRRA